MVVAGGRAGGLQGAGGGRLWRPVLPPPAGGSARNMRHRSYGLLCKLSPACNSNSQHINISWAKVCYIFKRHVITVKIMQHRQNIYIFNILKSN